MKLIFFVLPALDIFASKEVNKGQNLVQEGWLKSF